MSRVRIGGILFLLALLALSVFLSAGKAAASDGNSIKEDTITFPVQLSDGSSASIVGHLYYKGSYHNRILQVLVHGGTYNSAYWDVPTIDGVAYSYARYMADQHYALLAVDLLGSGASTRPPGDEVTLQETAGTLHQVLVSLGNGTNPVGYAFNPIVLVGHSFGSIVSTYLLGTYPGDAAGLVTTGSAHVPSVPPIPPSVIQQLEQTPYSYLPPDLRAQIFYYAPSADPAVIAYDNAHLADSIARGFLNTVFPIQFNDAASRVDLVQGPVLVQLGQNDALAPAVPPAQEAAHWPQAQVTVQILPAIGHDVNLHLNHLESWTLIDAWISTHIGR